MAPSRLDLEQMPRPRTPEETYGPALLKARQAFPHLDPRAAATCAGVSYEDLESGGGRFLLPFLGTIYEVGWPEGSVLCAADRDEADIATRILLLHYLLTADETAMADQWIAFRNLPGGLGYDAAFQGRANHRLAHAFGSDQAAFESAACSLAGEPLTFGDASFMFRILPRLWLAVVLYLADDEFPANANVLFDGSASHYLPTEDLAVLGGLLAGRLIKAARAG
jgi:hypothetical protein